MHLLCYGICLKNEITVEDMPRRKRERPLPSETDHPDPLPADAGELCSAAVHRAALRHRNCVCKWNSQTLLSFTFDRDSGSCQATKMQLLQYKNVSV